MLKKPILAFTAALALSGCGHPLQEQSTHLVKGAVEKGPFVLGSQVTLSALDASGNPTGQTFKTQTTDDLGQFSLSVTYSGSVAIEAQGYFFDELAGQVSTSTLTLEGFGALSSGAAELDVNVLTHLLSARVTHLMATGSSLAAASTQAQTELVTALGIGGAGFSLSQAANVTHLSGGDATADAYLLTVSLLFMQVATNTAPSSAQVAAQLQELLNDARAAFAATGTLPSTTVAALRQAQQQVDPEVVRRHLQARYASAVSSFTVPGIDAILDSDLDGFVNLVDGCPLVATGDGGAAPGVCALRRGLAQGHIGGGAILVADFDHDGTPDLITYNEPGSGLLWRGVGGGVLAAPTALPGLDGLALSVADVDHDLIPDLVGSVQNPLVTSDYSYSPVWFRGRGDGTFEAAKPLIAPSVVLATPDVDGGSASYSCSAQLADLDGDGRLDVVGQCRPENLALNFQGTSAVLTALQHSDGSFGPPARLDLPLKLALSNVVVGDFDGDGKADLLVGSCSGSSCSNSSLGNDWVASGGLWLAHGGGDGTFIVSALTTSLGSNYPYFTAADVNGDGKLDLVVGLNPVTGSPSLDALLNDGAGHFTASAAFHVSSSPSYYMQLVDLTGDAIPDLVFDDDDNLLVSAGTPSGWAPAQAIAVTPHTPMGLISHVFADLDGDRRNDLVAIALVPTAPDQYDPQLVSLFFNPIGWHSW